MCGKCEAEGQMCRLKSNSMEPLTECIQKPNRGTMFIMYPSFSLFKQTYITSTSTDQILKKKLFSQYFNRPNIKKLFQALFLGTMLHQALFQGIME